MNASHPTGRLRQLLRRLRESERGQGLVEYALIISVVALGSLAALHFLSGEISSLFNRAGASLAAGAGPGSGGTGNGPPPQDGTVINSGNPGAVGGLPAGGGSGNNIPVWNAGPGDGPPGFANAAGVFWGDPGSPPPSTYPVTVTELGRNITVNGCAFTIGGYTFYGVWLREPTFTTSNDWTIGGLNYEWACINAPAFTVVDATHLTSNWTGPANGTSIEGQRLSSSGGFPNTNDWYNEDTNTNAPQGTNEPGIYDNFGAGNNDTYNYFRSNGTAWLCTWQSTPSYSFAGNVNGRDNGCLATAPPLPPSGGSVTISNQGGGNASGYDDGDTLRATTSGWNTHGSAITGYTYTWARADTYDGNGSCDDNGSYSTVQGPTGNTSLTNDYATPNQGSGNGDSIRVTVTATNANGTSASTTDCVVVYNQ